METQQKIMETMLANQKTTGEVVNNLAAKVDLLTTQQKILETQHKMLETQVAQQASAFQRTPGRFPGQPEVNPKENVKAVPLRSGKRIGDPPVLKNASEPSSSGKSPESEKVEEVPYEDALHHASQNAGKDVGDSLFPPYIPKEKYVAPPAYDPPVPFPQRLAKAKVEKLFGKFMDMLKKLHIYIPFTDVMTQMPSYAKFLKEILSNKRKL